MKPRLILSLAFIACASIATTTTAASAFTALVATGACPHEKEIGCFKKTVSESKQEFTIHEKEKSITVVCAKVEIPNGEYTGGIQVNQAQDATEPTEQPSEKSAEIAKGAVIKPVYSGCEIPGLGGASVNLNKCIYELKLKAETTEASVSIKPLRELKNCTITVEDKFGLCKVEIKAEEGSAVNKSLPRATLANSGTNAILIKPEISEFTASTKGMCILPEGVHTGQYQGGNISVEGAHLK